MSILEQSLERVVIISLLLKQLYDAGRQLYCTFNIKPRLKKKKKNARNTAESDLGNEQPGRKQHEHESKTLG